ncbi:stalk domain-containing protein [Cohnella fermenti]|uniref:DNRLRE domain-containing protein n=1 Tax=Cohnella fermenti TaxID=2565925 RepID=A0A4S4BQ25_9BACL|nr:glycoside hydrolase family 88 protein [Cohnella fermenti]THF74698.1 DNRLRE domain-containing protein [Cohnella fermenti]
MSRHLKSIVVLALGLSVLTPTAAAEQPPIEIYYNGERVVFPIDPVIKENALFVPMRKLFEVVGSEVHWNNSKKSVIASKENNIIELNIGQRQAFSQGNGYELDAAPFTSEGYTLVPMRFVSESLGVDVEWNPETRQAKLTPRPSILPSIHVNDYLDPDPVRDISGVSLHNLEDSSSVRVATVSNTKLAVLSEASPTQSYPNKSDFELNGELGKQAKALLQFDLSSFEGKKIRAAYLQLTNHKNLDTNAARTIYVQEVYKPWGIKANWLQTDNGNGSWGAPGANSDEDASVYRISQSSFRIVTWEPSWFIDVTSSVQAWNTSVRINNGFLLTSDRNLSIFNPFTSGFKPQLIIEYADSDTIEPLSYRSKLRTALEFLSTNYTHGSWSDTSSGIINSQINADKLGLGDEYLKVLISFFDNYVGEDSKLKGGAAKLDSYYNGSMGKALIYLYQRTGEPKYKIAIDRIRAMFSTLKQIDGIYIEQNTFQSELSYLGTDFLAAYGEAFGDAEATDIAINQTLNLYDKLVSSATNGIPFTLMIRTGDIIGYPKGVGWSRGIGWLYAGLGKLLAYDSIKAHAKYPEFVRRYQEISSLLVSYQDKSGLWRNLMQYESSPLETTGTSMIALGMVYGVNEGVLPKSYDYIVNAALNGLQSYTRTGAEMGNAYPSNQDLIYTYPYLTTSRSSFGFWMELITTRELYRDKLI